MMVSFCAVLFLRDVLDEILNLIESVSVGFPSNSCKCQSQRTEFEMPGNDDSLYTYLRGSKSMICIMAARVRPLSSEFAAFPSLFQKFPLNFF